MLEMSLFISTTAKFVTKEQYTDKVCTSVGYITPKKCAENKRSRTESTRLPKEPRRAMQKKKNTTEWKGRSVTSEEPQKQRKKNVEKSERRIVRDAKKKENHITFFNSN